MLLLAVSGGVDSVVLCELCSVNHYQFAIAHCNFQLRGEESERDKEFVASLAEKYLCRFYLSEFDTSQYAAVNKLSIQEAARKLRYQWFDELTTRLSDSQHKVPSYTLTAHHADDNLETVVMNFFRGTGIQGMRGMLPKQGKVIRPLLPFRKSELVAFASERQLPWVEDSSNQTDKYTRNSFRKTIIPLIQDIYPEAEKNVLNNINRFAEIEILYREAVDTHLKNLLEQKGAELHIPVLKLQKVQPLATVIHEIISQFYFTASQVSEVIKLLSSDSGKYVQSATHRIIRNRNWLIIAPKETEKALTVLVESTDKKVLFDAGELSFEIHDSVSLANSPEIAQLDYNLVKFPLLLRKWKTGDYFYPLGMEKKKKLSRFFIDQKLSKIDKENVWVIEMDKKILWVIGLRIDNRFRVIDPSRPTLSITLKRQ